MLSDTLTFKWFDHLEENFKLVYTGDHFVHTEYTVYKSGISFGILHINEDFAILHLLDGGSVSIDEDGEFFLEELTEEELIEMKVIPGIRIE